MRVTGEKRNVGAGLRTLLLIVVAATCGAACSSASNDSSASTSTDAAYAAARDRLVEELAADIQDPRVLEAMRAVPRHRFVPESLQSRSYENRPLPIGAGQTISQPFIVARMTELLDLQPEDRVLEIGTGSGYQAAVLAELAGQVYSMEILPDLARDAETLLASLGYDNVHIRVADGFDGWPQEGPFDAIIVTAAPENVPPPLIEQLAADGKLVIPVGDQLQELLLLHKQSDDEGGVVTRQSIIPVRFVPMTGRAQTVLETKTESTEEDR